MSKYVDGDNLWDYYVSSTGKSFKTPKKTMSKDNGTQWYTRDGKPVSRAAKGMGSRKKKSK